MAALCAADGTCSQDATQEEVVVSTRRGRYSGDLHRQFGSQKPESEDGEFQSLRVLLLNGLAPIVQPDGRKLVSERTEEEKRWKYYEESSAPPESPEL